MQAKVKIIGQMSAAENILHVFPSNKKKGDFSAQALKKIPGVVRCGICVCGEPSPCGDLLSDFCEGCDIGSRSVFPEKEQMCRFDGNENYDIFLLNTPAHSFGFLILEIDDPKIFSLYSPFVSNFSNTMTIHMENIWQKEQLQIKNNALEGYRHHLESLVKERTKQLEKSEQLLDNTQKMAKIGGWEWDVKTKVMTWTDETYRIHGLDPANHENSSSENSLKCYDPAEQPVIWNAFQQCIKDKTPYDMQFCITTYQNRKVWIRTMGWPVLEDGRVIKVIGNIKDISDYKKLEEERIALTKQLQLARKADSLACMAGGIAHNYNNQLSVVMGNLELALEDIPADAVYHDNLTAAMQAARKSSEISGWMLTYLGQGSGEISQLDLSRLCRSYLPVLQTSLPKGIALETDFMPAGPKILANVNHMQIILTHLITNAAEAMGDTTGRIKLSTRVIPDSDIPGIVTAPADWHPKAGMYACLQVTDTGTGIAEQNMEKLFDPFFTTKFVGRGLGLPVILGLVKTWEGAVCVENRKDRGTRVRIYLPVPAHNNGTCNSY
ncbi:MAG: PAS domain-containing protein [Desulfotignum sp.]|nr:PAS domain-containing protein [Desulfotignum sp.]MCF8088907.1 PAS domain-containing protein [Desulfotignum sp.]MCF8139080.1 PAS domain-containing protein [Desulfotignum sp.]